MYSILQGTNSHFALSIQKDGQPYPDFSPLPKQVFSESTVLLRVNQSQDLDYERQHQLVFEVGTGDIWVPGLCGHRGYVGTRALLVPGLSKIVCKITQRNEIAK